MPSLQQFNSMDCISPDDRSLTGPDILHRHSINSLLERNELINRGLSSPIEGGTLSIDLGNGTSRNIRLGSQNGSISPSSNNYTSLMSSSSTGSSISPGISMSSTQNFDAFSFDNIGQNAPLKVFQRNLSFDCSTPISPSTPPSLYSRSFHGSPQISDCSSPGVFEPSMLYSGISPSRSNSPESDDNSGKSNNENNNLADMMQQYQLHFGAQQQQHNQYMGNIAQNAGLGFTAAELELAKLHKIQALDAMKLLQQAHSPMQLPLIGLNQVLQSYNPQNQLNNFWTQQINSSDENIMRAARMHRASAARHDATCTWSGALPIRSHKDIKYSPKLFLGGIPWDISEPSLIQIFRPFGPIKVEWPGKEQQTAQPKGFVYIIFETERQVRALLHACSIKLDDKLPDVRHYFYKISSKRIKAKEVEVIPWIIPDSNFVQSASQKLDPSTTVFVGALHGQLTAAGLATVMDDLFGGVVYAGIDTDKYKYPIGSGRVTFSNRYSHQKAVLANFIEIKTAKFTKKVQVDPYLEDALCSVCGVQHGPYYCRELSCFRYFCRSCWEWKHNTDKYSDHYPLTRNSKSQQLIGIGPQSSTSSSSVGIPAHRSGAIIEANSPAAIIQPPRIKLDFFRPKCTGNICNHPKSNLRQQ